MASSSWDDDGDEAQYLEDLLRLQSAAANDDVKSEVSDEHDTQPATITPQLSPEPPLEHAKSEDDSTESETELVDTWPPQAGQPDTFNFAPAERVPLTGSASHVVAQPPAPTGVLAQGNQGLHGGTVMSLGQATAVTTPGNAPSGKVVQLKPKTKMSLMQGEIRGPMQPSLAMPQGSITTQTSMMTSSPVIHGEIPAPQAFSHSANRTLVAVSHADGRTPIAGELLENIMNRVCRDVRISAWAIDPATGWLWFKCNTPAQANRLQTRLNDQAVMGGRHRLR